MVLLSLPRIGQFLGIFTYSYSHMLLTCLANTSVWLTCPMTFFCQYIGCTWFLKLVNIINFQWKQKCYILLFFCYFLLLCTIHQFSLQVKCLAYPIIRNIWCSKIHPAEIFVLIDSNAIFLKEENFRKKLQTHFFWVLTIAFEKSQHCISKCLPYSW